MVEKAVAFATKCHEGTCRKGTHIPYIVQITLETAVIASLMTEDEELICAALLHDVNRGCGRDGITELEKEFGMPGSPSCYGRNRR